MKYQCPVCMFPELPYPPANYHICPCCGTEFGNDDDEYSHDQLREMWVATGAHWFFGRSPEGWNPWLQLIEGHHPEAVMPKLQIEFTGIENTVARNLYSEQAAHMTLQFQS